MGRKTIVGIENIKAAALEVFFEKGYEDASMRDIATKASCSVGLAYNYFKTKDEVFKGAMDVFFNRYKADFAKIVSDGKRNPFQTLTFFFDYMETETLKFRQEFASKIHWTVRYAIREMTISTIEPYIYEIIELIIKWGAKPRISSEALTNFLAYGVGSLILHDEVDDYYRIRQEMTSGVHILMNLDLNKANYLIPKNVKTGDYKHVCEFVGHEIANFEDKVNNDEIVMFASHNTIYGVVIVDKKTNTIELLKEDERFSQENIAFGLLVTGLARFKENSHVIINSDNSMLLERLGGKKIDKAKYDLVAPSDAYTLFLKVIGED